MRSRSAGELPGDTEQGHALARALGPQYRVVRLLGRGGFAEVYEVVDEDLRRRLAVKALRADLPWSPATLARFKQEARAIARLHHPNTLPIHFVGEGPGLAFYVMPYLEGRTLADILRSEGALPLDRALAIAEPILETLQHAHEHGLVHRDVKPDNILIEQGTGRPLLVDFGIVKCLDGGDAQTQTGFIVGTPLYMSPEQALGRRDVDARSDVYGMGVVLFQMLTGAPPFEGDDSQEIVGRHLHEPVPVATLSGDRTPPWIRRIVLRCLAKHPDDRHQSAHAVLEALREGRRSAASVRHADDDTPTVDIPRIAPARRSGRRRTMVAVGLVAAVGALWASVRPQASLFVANHLTEPIALSLEDTGFTIAPDDSVRLPLHARQPLEAHWAMVRPTGTDGRVLGEELEGSIARDAARGEIRERIGGVSADGVRHFSPLVVNETPRRLRAVVLVGDDSADCGCSIAPGDSIRLGYYPMLAGAAVRVTDVRGAAVRLDVATLGIDSASGRLVLRVTPELLVAPPLRQRRRADQRPPVAEPPNPVRSFLPVR